MGLLDYVATPGQRLAYLFPEKPNLNESGAGGYASAGVGFITKQQSLSDVFIFQFWPQQVQDNYTPNYATKNIPGASHPIFQWTSGNGRDISFTAQFVSELREDQGFTGADTNSNSDFRSRISASAATSPTLGSVTTALGTAMGALMLPSARYVVNVASAIGALQQYLYPSYGDNNDLTHPPKKLVLVLPGTRLGRKKDADGILCIMRSASVTHEAYFPTGEIRSASVALKFSEIIQLSSSSGVSKIKYIGQEAYNDLAGPYLSTVANPGELTLS